MDRIPQSPRANRAESLTKNGAAFATDSYWNESVAYRLGAAEVTTLSDATTEIWARLLDACANVVERDRFAELGISPAMAQMARASWERREVMLVGRLDLAYDGFSPPKLLEVNTETNLLEPATMSPAWRKQVQPTAADAGNLDEALVNAWKSTEVKGRIHVLAMRDAEAEATGCYLVDTAIRAGVDAAPLSLDNLGFNPSAGFCDATASDAATAVVTNAYKLYPWAWLVADAEQNGSVASLSSVRWLEPAWTVMLTSKGILPILWEMFPGHRNLLETYTSPRSSLVRYVQKPVQSREGANVRVVTMGATEAESADNNYGAEGYVYQAYGPVFHDSAVTAVVGSWVVQGKWAALGVREDKGLITGADSVNVPIYVA